MNKADFWEFALQRNAKKWLEKLIQAETPEIFSNLDKDMSREISDPITLLEVAESLENNKALLRQYDIAIGDAFKRLNKALDDQEKSAIRLLITEMEDQKELLSLEESEDASKIYFADESFCLSTLAVSHVFFDGHLADLDEQEKQTHLMERYKTYQKLISQILGASPSTQMNAKDFPDAELMEESIDAVFEICQSNEIRFWPLADKVIFLSHEQEDEDLPIEINFGRLLPAEYTKLQDFKEATRSLPFKLR